MSVELLGNIIANRLSASPSERARLLALSGISATDDLSAKQRLITLSQNLAYQPQTCATLRRAGLAEKAVDLAAAGSRFSVQEVDKALAEMPLQSGIRGDKEHIQNGMAFKLGLQQLELL